MSTTEEILHRVQQLPEEASREILHFIGYLEVKYGLTLEQLQYRQQIQQATPGRIQENPNDAVWNDLLFRQPH